ncbi:rootletin [Cocos nucifera]|nr:rootletin [Cocos nucifera]
MERKGNAVPFNPSDAPKKDQTQTPTLDQDREGDGEGKKADADSDGTINLLLDEIRALKALKRELELRLDDVCKELHRVEVDNRSIASYAHFLEGKLAGTRRDLASTSEAEDDRLKRGLKDLEADKAKLADANAALEAEISALKVRLLAAAEGKEVDVPALRTKANLLETRVIGLTEDLRRSKEEAAAAVRQKVILRELQEEDLDQEVKALEETKTRLERELAGVRSQIEGHLEMQRKHDADVAATARVNQFFRVVAGVASLGALLVVGVTIYDLRIVRKR